MSPEGVPAEPRARFGFAGTEVEPGERVEIEIPVERLATGPQITIPTIVVHGRRSGPVVSISAAIHGDEINGVEAIRLLLGDLRAEEIAGTLLFTPVVNELGFTMGQRYLPDRRDLNRAFPGTPRGSLAGRIAHLFMGEVIERCTYAIDLHCGSDSRANLPQIRADLDHPPTRACAEAFAAPMLVHAQTRDGSLRQAASERGIAMLLYEGGESSRFDDYAIEAAHHGVLRVLNHLGTIDSSPGSSEETRTSRNTRWVRASRAGLFRADLELGDTVSRRGVLGHLSDIFGRQNLAVRAPMPGVVIGLARKPVVNQGDALVHVAEVEPG
ncbi:MAG: succinylglutamate desuccinylase/aspartoacylase family protein [Solirubrobacterales bacterium]